MSINNIRKRKWEDRSEKLDSEIGSEKSNDQNIPLQNPASNIQLLTPIIFLTFLFLSSPQSVLAAKQRVWTSTPLTTTTAKIYKPSFTVKFNTGRKGLIIKFSDLNTASPVTYELTYSTNGLDQGVVGAISLSEGKTASRELLFGTCSKNVCTYHTNIQNAQLKITSKLKTDKTYIKTYKIKI